jgi:hypothetical protein
MVYLQEGNSGIYIIDGARYIINSFDYKYLTLDFIFFCVAVFAISNILVGTGINLEMKVNIEKLREFRRLRK